MRHLIISHENGQPYYYDHSNGQMLSMSFGIKMTFGYSIAADRWRYIRTDNTKILFSLTGQLHFLLISDEGDSKHYLAQQIQFFTDLLCLKYGPDVYEENVRRTKKKALVSLFNNTKRLFTKKQAYLLACTERLDMTDEKAFFIASQVKRIFAEFGFPKIQNLLITTSTKVILNYVIPKKGDPIPVNEVLLLIAFIHAHFYPMEEDFQERVFQATDLREHADVKPNFKYGKEYFDTFTKESEDGFVSCDSGTDSSPPTEMADSQLLSSKQVELRDIPTEEKKVVPPPEEYKKIPRRYISEPLQSQVYLKSTGRIYSLHGFEMEPHFHLTVLTSGEVTDEEMAQLEKLNEAIKDALAAGIIHFMAAIRQTHLESIKLTYIHQLPGLVHFIYAERNNEKIFAPKISGLVGKTFECEGLPTYRANCKKFLREKIWDLVFHGQNSLMNGFHTMLISCGDFQYSYRLWFEDPETSVILPIEKPLKPSQSYSDAYPENVLTSDWYQDLTKILFPNNKRVKCYELYTLYLNGLNAKTIVSHNNTLVDGIRSR